MSREYAFRQVDVFTDRIFGGNPLAVFTAADGLSGGEMQAIAQEMNLSETTFVLPPEDPAHIARVRIFTPRDELPFAGHPTIGTAWVLARQGAVPDADDQITLELGVGPITVAFDDSNDAESFIWMNQGTATFGEPVADRASLAAALALTEDDLFPDLPIQVVSTGLPFLFVPLASQEAVDRAALSHADFHAAAREARGAFVFHSAPASNRAYSRMMATIGGVVWEDPATGSASGPLGAYLVKHGLSSGQDAVEIVSEQGTQMGRQSFVHIRVGTSGGKPGVIHVGGTVVPVFEGLMRLPG